ncbi:MAG: hypothetical protein IPH07_38415 [Deltaproteobacteria bacterium]|jgi:hypothetical protein|nr:hypothetical protein [Deltaproteobacteria bacterium]MBK8713702.1 hypothetical protein [Deltaproteobacteria bacterium]
MRAACLAIGIAVLGSSGCEKSASSTPGQARGYTIEPADYGENANAPEKTRTRCKFEMRVSQELAEAIEARGTGDGADKRIALTVVRMDGAEPAWEGVMNVLVEGELVAHGDRTAGFSVRGSSRPGVGGGQSGVCAGLDDIAEQMAEAIVPWLADPKDGAELDAREPE